MFGRPHTLPPFNVLHLLQCLTFVFLNVRSDALMALPSLSSLKHQSGEQNGSSNHGLHGHHHHLHHPHQPHHHPHTSAHHHLNSSMLSSLRSLHSTDLPTSLERNTDSPQLNGGTNSSSSVLDEKPVAVVHGKKNRLAYGPDDDAHSVSSLKRFCLQAAGAERANGDHSSSSSVHTVLLASNGTAISSGHHEAADGGDGGHGEEHGHHCNDECYSGGQACPTLRHSSSVPDLRSNSVFTSVAAAAVASASSNPPVITSHGSSASSPSSSSTSAPTTSTSFFSQIISSQINNLSSVNGHIGSPSLSHELSHSSSSRHTSKFQYVLGASTSMAIKVHEETMTYLNQGMNK